MTILCMSVHLRMTTNENGARPGDTRNRLDAAYDEGLCSD